MAARHAGASRRHSCAANPLSHSNGKAGCDPGHPGLFPIPPRHRTRLRRRRCASNEPQLRGARDEPASEAAGHCRHHFRRLPSDGRSGAIVYCATRNATERVAEFLRGSGFEAGHFHAGLTPDAKRDVQERFRSSHLRVIAATSAFGMGIDKPDVRLVLHADIPGSLESYAQEAGRAGRDREPAACVLLHCDEDVERQFDLTVRSRLERSEIGGVLKSVRRLDRRSKQEGLVVATSGEILKRGYRRCICPGFCDGRYAREDCDRLAGGSNVAAPGREPRVHFSVFIEGADRAPSRGDPRRGRNDAEVARCTHLDCSHAGCCRAIPWSFDRRACGKSRGFPLRT